MSKVHNYLDCKTPVVGGGGILCRSGFRRDGRDTHYLQRWTFFKYEQGRGHSYRFFCKFHIKKKSKLFCSKVQSAPKSAMLMCLNRDLLLEILLKYLNRCYCMACGLKHMANEKGNS